MSNSENRPQPIRVLLLEDSRFDAELLTEALREIHPTASIRLESDEAGFVDAVTHDAPDLILSDYELPGFSGAQALAHALILAPHVPFIFVSGVIGEDNAVELLKLGATDYVSKGRLARLEVVVERALRESSGRASREEAEGKLREINRAFSRVDRQRLLLVDLSDRIRDMDDRVEIAYTGVETIGRELNVSRVGYGIVNKVAESLQVDRDWCAPGIASGAGTHRFRDYGSYIDDLARGTTVAIADVRADARTRGSAPALEAVHARALLNMPLTEAGNMVGLIYLNNGQPRTWASEEIQFVREVGDRIRNAIARRQAQADLQVLADSLESQVQARTHERDRTWALSQDLLGIANLDGYFESVNPAWTAVLGWSATELCDNPYQLLIHPDDLDASNEALEAFRTGESHAPFENRYRTKSGDYRWLSWTAVPDGERLYAAARDVTEQKERAIELEGAKEQLRQSQKLEAVGQLTGGLAHDFNNLLGAITGSLELIRRRGLEGRFTELDRYIEVAQGAARRAAALTHRLLAFSRRQTLEPKTVDANRLVANMQELIGRTLGPAITLEVVGAVGLWMVQVDPNQLENALLNLCINSRDAMPQGGRLTIETANRWLDERTARERDVPPGQYVSLCVSDNGVGMSPDVIARAFDPFFTTKPIGMGTGLGLSMIYGFTNQSGGQVRIYSEVGQGTMVCLYLPRHVGVEHVADERPVVAESPKADRGQTVLVVDDEAALRMLIVEVMQELGYHTLEAGDGAEAMKYLQSGERIDLLVTDVGLPGGMNGRQVADAARVARAGLNVLFITGYAENAVLSHGHLDSGMHVLTKPFDLGVLARRVRELIDPAAHSNA